MFKLINDDMRPGVQILARETEDKKVIPCVCPYRAAYLTIRHVIVKKKRIGGGVVRVKKQINVLNEFYCGTNCPHFAFIEEASDPVTGITDGDTGIRTCKRFIVIESKID